MKWAGKVPYRCRDCNKRFYVERHTDQKLQMEKRRKAERFATVIDTTGEPLPFNRA